MRSVRQKQTLCLASGAEIEFVQQLLNTNLGFAYDSTEFQILEGNNDFTNPVKLRFLKILKIITGKQIAISRGDSG